MLGGLCRSGRDRRIDVDAVEVLERDLDGPVLAVLVLFSLQSLDAEPATPAIANRDAVEVLGRDLDGPGCGSGSHPSSESGC